MTVEAIIFDVDGTLWDSTEEVAVSWNATLKKETNITRQVTALQLKKEFGKPLAEIMRDLFPELTEEERSGLSEKLFKNQNKYMETAPCKCYPMMEETIRQLSRQYMICIVSNCQSGYIEAFLKNTNLSDYITDFTCPGDTGKLKGDNIRLIMERNNIQTAVYVGDTQGDADACKKAGIPMIFAAYGFGNVEGEYPEIHGFEELAEKLHR